MRRRVLTPAERRSLQERISDRQEGLTTPELSGMSRDGGPLWSQTDRPHTQNTNRERMELQRAKRILASGEVGQISQADKLKIDRRIRDLERFVKEKQIMAPDKYFHQKRSNDKDYHKTVNHIAKVEMDPRVVETMNELKNLKRMRDPDNPNSGNIESLRGT